MINDKTYPKSICSTLDNFDVIEVINYNGRTTQELVSNKSASIPQLCYNKVRDVINIFWAKLASIAVLFQSDYCMIISSDFIYMNGKHKRDNAGIEPTALQITNYLIPSLYQPHHRALLVLLQLWILNGT